MLWCSYMMYRTFRVMIEQDEQNTFHASVPVLPGCHSWGDSLAEARANIREAIDVHVSDDVTYKPEFVQRVLDASNEPPTETFQGAKSFLQRLSSGKPDLNTRSWT